MSSIAQMIEYIYLQVVVKEKKYSKQDIFNLQSDIVKKWREGADEKNKILISTTTFSTENDYPEVQVVILATTPFDMSTALQEMGRAGRDGKLAKCYIIPAMKILPCHSIDDSWDLKGCKAIYDMIWTSTKCLRLCFTRYIDEGRGITCLQDLQNQICSRCQDKVQPDLQTVEMPNQLYIGITDQTLPVQFTKQHLPSISTIHSITQTHIWLKTKHLQPIQNHSSAYVSTSMLSPINANTLPIETFDNLFLEEHKDPEKSFVEQARLAKKRKVKIKFKKENYMVSLRRAFDAIDGKCTVCMVEKRSIISGHDHMANRCTHLDFGRFLQWKKNIRYTIHIHGPICACCHVPQIDNNLHKWISQGASVFYQCSYPDKILLLVFAVFHHSNTCHHVEAFFRVHWSTEIQYAK